MRRAWLRGRENIAKRYLIHVAGFNLGVLMRVLVGYGTPRERAEAPTNAFLFIIRTDSATGFVIIADIGCAPAMLVVIAAPEPA
jgi:transposase